MPPGRGPTSTGWRSLSSTSRARLSCASSARHLRQAQPCASGTRSRCTSRELGLQLRPRALLIAVALLRERLRVDVVPPNLPEPSRVLLAELEPGQPLRALPRVALRHDQSQRPPVLGRESLAVVPPRAQHAA